MVTYQDICAIHLGSSKKFGHFAKIWYGHWCSLKRPFGHSYNTITSTVLHQTAIFVYISDLKSSMFTFICDNVLKYPFILTQMDYYSNGYWLLMFQLYNNTCDWYGSMYWMSYNYSCIFLTYQHNRTFIRPAKANMFHNVLWGKLSETQNYFKLIRGKAKAMRTQTIQHKFLFRNIAMYYTYQK